MKVLVTPRSITAAGGHPSLQLLRDAGYEVVLGPAGRQPTAEELRALLPGCLGYLAGTERIEESLLNSADALRIIARNGVGIDSIDLAAARARGIKVAITPGANARGVAELAIALLFSLARMVPPSDRAIKQGGWQRYAGIELQGATLGVVGCGRIGAEVAQLAMGIGMNVLGYDPMPCDQLREESTFQFAPLDEVISHSDAITLHCPPPNDGKPLIDSQSIATMKRSAYLINTARHALIDHAALLNGLNSGQIGGAALDVFAAEPPSADEIVCHERVICTPHIGGYTRQSVDRSMQAAVEALLKELMKKTLVPSLKSC